jgi:dodecin
MSWLRANKKVIESLRNRKRKGQNYSSSTEPKGRGNRISDQARRDRHQAGRRQIHMEEHVYKVLELVGSSEKSIEDAIQNAIIRASKTLREMKWFEVLQTRGHIENGSVRHYQVTLKVGFTLEK